MSQWNESGQRSFEAAADLSAKQFTAVKLDTDGKIVAATAATDKIIGILLNAPVAGEVGAVALRNAGGTCKILAGEALATRMTRLTIDSSGRAIAGTQTADGTKAAQEMIGQNIGVAGAANDVIEIALADYLW